MRRILPLALIVLACATGPRTVDTLMPPTSCASIRSTDSTTYDTTQVTEKPTVHLYPELDYPERPLAHSVQGIVTVAAVVGSTGKVDSTSLAVLQGIDPDLDAEALRHVKLTTYWPGCRGGYAVPVKITVHVGFHISPGLRGYKAGPPN